MMTWQEELRVVLDEVGRPGAERLIRAIDEGRMDPNTYGCETECGTVACVYGHCHGNQGRAIAAGQQMRLRLYFSVMARHLVWGQERAGSIPAVPIRLVGAQKMRRESRGGGEGRW